MGKENEIAILDIDKGEAVRRLREIGARRTGAYKFRRIEFLLRGSVKGGHSWGRVRADGRKTTITVKEMRGSGGYSSMEEHEIRTADFGDTVRLVTRLVNPKLVIYFENEREEYSLGRARITIDKWPKIPALMEIEAPSMAAVKGIYRRLKIKGRFAGNSSIHKVYKSYGLDFRKVMQKNAPMLKRLVG